MWVEISIDTTFDTLRPPDQPGSNWGSYFEPEITVKRWQIEEKFCIGMYWELMGGLPIFNDTDADVAMFSY